MENNSTREKDEKRMVLNDQPSTFFKLHSWRYPGKAKILCMRFFWYTSILLLDLPNGSSVITWQKYHCFHLYFIHRNRSKRFLWLHHTYKESHLNELITFFHISSWCQSNLKNNLPFINDRQQIWIISDPLLCHTPITLYFGNMKMPA